MREFWRELFESAAGRTEDSRPDTYIEGAGILDEFEYSIGTIELGSADLEIIRDNVESRAWFAISVDASNSIGSIAAVTSSTANGLHRSFGSDLWKCATAEEVKEALRALPSLGKVVFHDVGQGASISLFPSGRGRSAAPSVAYFDVGAGSRSDVARLDYCTCGDPLVILSHWDRDHWLGAERNVKLHRQTWLVPHQITGPTENALAVKILQNGRLLVLKRSSRPMVTASPTGQMVTLQHGSGPSSLPGTVASSPTHVTKNLIKTLSKLRNSSGLALIVEAPQLNKAWLFPGDASYNYLAPPTSEIVVLQATHHGGSFGPKKTVAPKRAKKGRAKLVYSHGWRSPSSQSIGAHKASNWRHGGIDDRSTRNGPGGTRSSIVAGWFGTELPPKHLIQKHPREQIST